jgi:hypothetical protein
MWPNTTSKPTPSKRSKGPTNKKPGVAIFPLADEPRWLSRAPGASLEEVKALRCFAFEMLRLFTPLPGFVSSSSLCGCNSSPS